MFKIAVLTMAVMLAAMLVGCTNRGNTNPIGMIEAYQYNGQCQTIVSTETHKMIVEGNHTFKPGQHAYLIEYEQKDNKVIRILSLPEIYKHYLIVKIDEP